LIQDKILVCNIDSRTRHLDSIVARALLVADFINSIDPQPTFEGLLLM
jgi:hypothetical protein